MEIEYTIECLEEDIPVRGNALASGDDAEDRKCEDEITRRLDRGDLWAWCHVRVTARIVDMPHLGEGRADLGCCSYENERDFKVDGGYYKQMCDEAREDLINDLRSGHANGIASVEALVMLGEPLIKS